METSLSTSELPANTWFFGPIRTHNPNGIPHLDRFSRFWTHDRRVSLYFTMGRGRPFPPQDCPFRRGIWTPSNMWFSAWDHPSPQLWSRGPVISYGDMHQSFTDTLVKTLQVVFRQLPHVCR